MQIVIVLLLVLILLAVVNQPYLAQRAKRRMAEAAEARRESVEQRRYEAAKRSRELAGKRALSIHAKLVDESKRLCSAEGLVCDEYGRPEEWKKWSGDNSQESKVKCEKARRVAENYRPTLLRSLRDAIGDELMAKLGEPEVYLFPTMWGDDLAYCRLVFEHVDKTIFDGLPLPQQPDPGRWNAAIIPEDRDIEVSHTASFGSLDFGEEYLPGDLRVTVGVKTADDVTSYYRDWRYQINPTPYNFLKHLRNFSGHTW